MTMIPDDELEDRIRASLTRWADDAPVSVDRADELDRHRRARLRPRVLIAAAAAVAVIAYVGAVLPRDDGTPTVAGPGSSIQRIAVGKATGVRTLVADGQALWLMSTNDGVLYRIDPRTDRVVATHDVGTGYEGMAAGDGLVWLAGYGPPRVVAVDQDTGAVVHEINLDGDPWGVTLAFGAAWIGGAGGLVRVDPTTGVATTHELGFSTGFLAASADALWVADPEGTRLAQIDPRSGVVDGFADGGDHPRSVAVAPEGDVWVTLPDADEVVRIDATTRKVTARVSTGRWPNTIAFVGDDAWVSDFHDGTITRIDRRDARVVAMYPAGNRPGAVVSAFGRVWVSLHQEASVLAIDPHGALLEVPPATFAQTITVDGRNVELRCRGEGRSTVVLVQDVWYDAGAVPTLEALLAARTRVCIAGPEDRVDRAEQLAPDLRAALERARIPGPFVVVGFGYGGLVARELASTLDGVEATVLVDENTLPPSDRGTMSPFMRSVAEWFDKTDGLGVDVPTVVVTSDPDVATDDPRVGDGDTRRQFHANQLALADRLGAKVVVDTGDPWPPTYRPAALVSVILERVNR